MRATPWPLSTCAIRFAVPNRAAAVMANFIKNVLFMSPPQWRSDGSSPRLVHCSSIAKVPIKVVLQVIDDKGENQLAAGVNTSNWGGPGRVPPRLVVFNHPTWGQATRPIRRQARIRQLFRSSTSGSAERCAKDRANGRPGSYCHGCAARLRESFHLPTARV